MLETKQLFRDIKLNDQNALGKLLSKLALEDKFAKENKW